MSIFIHVLHHLHNTYIQPRLGEASADITTAYQFTVAAHAVRSDMRHELPTYVRYARAFESSLTRLTQRATTLQHLNDFEHAVVVLWLGYSATALAVVTDESLISVDEKEWGVEATALTRQIHAALKALPFNDCLSLLSRSRAKSDGLSDIAEAMFIRACLDIDTEPVHSLWEETMRRHLEPMSPFLLVYFAAAIAKHDRVATLAFESDERGERYLCAVLLDNFHYLAGVACG